MSEFIVIIVGRCLVFIADVAHRGLQLNLFCFIMNFGFIIIHINFYLYNIKNISLRFKKKLNLILKYAPQFHALNSAII